MRWRGWSAWLGSVLAHALLAALLLLRAARPMSRATRVPAAPIEVEITDGPRSESSNRNAPVRPDDRGPVDWRSLAQPRSDEPPSRSAPHRPTEGSPERAPEAAPERAPEGAPERALESAPGLSFRTLSPDVQARLAISPDDASLVARPGKLSLDELRVERERQEDAVASVSAGRVDPLLYDYLRGARVRFEDEAKEIAEKIPIGAGQALRGWGRGLMQRVEEIHRGDPVADQVRPDLRTDAEKQRPDLFAAYEESRRQAEAGAEIRRAEICLDVAPGRETTATLRRGSGNVALDRVALDAFARSVSARPVPPDARAGRACYEVRIAAFRVPPAPGLSCDLNLFGPHGPSCVWPTKKVTTVTSQLLSVEYPAKPSEPTARSLLGGAR
jgi:hypothetical protein